MSSRFATPKQTDLAIAIVRIATGITFTAHGYQKISMMGLSGVGGFFGQLGIPFPGIAAFLIILLEFGGGILLTLGVLTRFVAAFFILDMAGAIFFVHAKNGFFLPTGFEFVGLLLISALALVVGGPGAFSADRIFPRKTATEK